MAVVSYIVLILLSFFAYSTGSVVKAGKSVDLKPEVLDLFLILAIWAGAIYSRVVFDWNKWLLILAWIIVSLIIGILATWPRKPRVEQKSLKATEPEKTPTNPLKRLWQSWGNLSKRIGGFQTRVFLSLFFFVFVSPFALIMKRVSDPLRIRYQDNDSHWLPKAETEVDLEQFRRQF